MNRCLGVGLCFLVLGSPAFAGFTVADFLQSGSSQTGLANGFVTPPTPFTSIANQDIQDVSTPAGQGLPPPLETTATTGVLATDQRRALTSSTAGGIAEQGGTLEFTVSASADGKNGVDLSNHYKSASVAQASFVGDITVANDIPGIAIGYNGLYTLGAFAQNGAPGGFNNNSGYASVQAVLTVENLTTSIMEGESVFVSEMVSQVFCGEPCLPNYSFNNPFSGTTFVPINGASNGDVLRITIEATAMADSYAKAFNDPTGGRQPAGGIGFASFDEMSIDLLLIPEPSSLALVLVGMGAFGLARKRGGRGRWGT